MNTTMMNKVELNDEMLAQVSGGNSVNESEEKHGGLYFYIPEDLKNEILEEERKRQLDAYYNSEEFERDLEEINRKLREMTPNFVELVWKYGRTN